MTDEIKKKPTTKANLTKKPPTQIAGVGGINAHGGMGEAPSELPFQQYINWQTLTKLPAFEMFVLEQSGQKVGEGADNWIGIKRASLGDDALYSQYEAWHTDKGLWANETPTGKLKK